MDLYLLRHGIAAPRGHGGDDAARPLTADGEARVRRIARGMRAIGCSFDLILSSPYARARRTAEIVARELGAARRMELSADLEPGGDPARLLRRLSGPATRAPESVLLVGHEPYLSGLIATLVGGEAPLEVTMKKGGLCRLRVGTPTLGRRCASLEWLLAPKHLAKLAQG